MIKEIKAYIGRKKEIKENALKIWDDAVSMSVAESRKYDDIVDGTMNYAITQEVVARRERIKQTLEGMEPSYRADVMAKINKRADKLAKETNSSNYNNARDFLKDAYFDAVVKDDIIVHRP